MPLFTIYLTDEAVRMGLPSRIIQTNVTTLSGLHIRNDPVVLGAPLLGTSSVTGNYLGFYYATPKTNIQVLNGSAINVTLTPLPAYSIQVGESLLLYTTLRELLDMPALIDDRDVDELHHVGSIVTVRAHSAISLPSIVTVSVMVGGGLVGGVVAAELQGVGALALMICADPNTQGRFVGSYRILSPFAVADSFAGVVVGNVLLSVLVLLLQMCVLLVLRSGKPAQDSVDRMARARFPSLSITATAIFHVGTARIGTADLPPHECLHVGTAGRCSWLCTYGRASRCARRTPLSARRAGVPGIQARLAG